MVEFSKKVDFPRQRLLQQISQGYMNCWLLARLKESISEADNTFNNLFLSEGNFGIFKIRLL